MVAHLTGGQGVAGSNPVSPTTQTPLETRIQGASDTATHTPSLTQSLTRTENRVADPNQFPLAARLAEELETAGHDNIHTLDILDCLGKAGLVVHVQSPGPFTGAISGTNIPIKARRYIDRYQIAVF